MRFAVLDDERNLVLGKDFNNIFKKGFVYEVREIMGEHIITCLGENSHGKKKDGKFGYGYDMNRTMQFMPNILITQEEIKGKKIYGED